MSKRTETFEVAVRRTTYEYATVTVEIELDDNVEIELDDVFDEAEEIAANDDDMSWSLSEAEVEAFDIRDANGVRVASRV